MQTNSDFRQTRVKDFIAAPFSYLSHDLIRTRPQATSPPPLFSVLVAVSGPLLNQSALSQSAVHISLRGIFFAIRRPIRSPVLFASGQASSLVLQFEGVAALRKLVGDYRATCGNSDDIRSFPITTHPLE